MTADTPSADIRDRILTFLEERRILTLATCSRDHPWACTLAFAYDDDLNLYFVSKRDVRHVEELEANPRVACAIHEPQETYDRERVRGLQLVGSAARVPWKDVPQTLRVYTDRFTRLDTSSLKELLKIRDAGVYRITPDRIWFLDKADLGRRVEFVP